MPFRRHPRPLTEGRGGMTTPAECQLVFAALPDPPTVSSLNDLCAKTNMHGYKISLATAILATLGCIKRHGGSNGARRTYQAVRPPTDAELQSMCRISAENNQPTGHIQPHAKQSRPFELDASLSLAKEEAARQERAVQAYAKNADQIRSSRANGMSLKKLRAVYGENALNFALGNVTPFGD